MSVSCTRCPSCEVYSPDEEFLEVDLSEMDPSDFQEEGGYLDWDVSYVRCPACGAVHNAYELATGG